MGGGHRIDENDSTQIPKRLPGICVHDRHVAFAAHADMRVYCSTEAKRERVGELLVASHSITARGEAKPESSFRRLSPKRCRTDNRGKQTGRKHPQTSTWMAAIRILSCAHCYPPSFPHS